jgi:zinc protease
VFSNRLMEAMRERAGAAYSPQVATDWPVDVDNGGRIMALAQVPPAAVPVFFAEAERIAADLIANGPNADELQRVTEPMRQMIDRGTSGSYFWMIELAGGLFDSRRVESVRTLREDYSVSTPEKMRALAARYLGEGRAFRMAVIPEGQPLATSSAAVPADPVTHVSFAFGPAAA